MIKAEKRRNVCKSQDGGKMGWVLREAGVPWNVGGWLWIEARAAPHSERGTAENAKGTQSGGISDVKRMS